MEKLTVEHIAPYMPFGLIMVNGGFSGELEHLRLNGEFRVSCSSWWEQVSDNKYKPELISQQDFFNDKEKVKELATWLWKDEPEAFDSIENGILWVNAMSEDVLSMPYKVVCQLLKQHVDIYHLIEAGLAIRKQAPKDLHNKRDK